jgi:hypothetical protein
MAGELHAPDKELSRRTQHCRRMSGYWQGIDRVMAGERHGVCESAFNTAGELHGMCESAFRVFPVFIRILVVLPSEHNTLFLHIYCSYSITLLMSRTRFVVVCVRV